MGTVLGTAQTTGLTESQVTTIGSSALSTGDLRRRYDFSDKISELKVNVDPFFRFLSKYRKNPTDDSEFKFTERRPSFHKRYGYVVGHSTTAPTAVVNEATITAGNVEAGDTYYWMIGTDYKSAGNIGNKFGQTSGEVQVGASGTKPQFFVPGLHIKINTSTAYNAGAKDYLIARIDEVTTVATNYVNLKTTILKTLNSSSNVELCSYVGATDAINAQSLAAYKISGTTDCLEAKRVYVSGNSWGRGTGYPETWGDNPFSTSEGQTEIFKTALGMDNTTIATVLKYEGNEFARLWGEKLLEHRWDMETSFLFSSLYTDNDDIRHTQGVIDYAINYGHVFTWTSSYNCDNFLDDMSEIYDVRTQAAQSTIHYVDKELRNWLNKVSGYHQQTIDVTSGFRSDFAFEKRGSVAGVEVNKISTIHGDFNFVYNCHLDGSPVKIVSVPINNVAYRPLIGNKNRDTAVYAGVQSLETTGIDAEVSLILTEAACTQELPENWAVWTI